MEREGTRNIVFQHLIDLPKCDCVFCSGHDTDTGKTRLFLFFNEEKCIYVRDGVSDPWGELIDHDEYAKVLNSFERAIMERQISCFSS